MPVSKCPLIPLCLLVILCATGVASLGQTQTGVPATETLSLTAAFERALRANKDLAVAAQDVEVADGRSEAAHGEFDITAFAEGAYADLQTATATDPPDVADSDNQSLRAGFRKRFITGTDLELAAESSRYSREETEDGLGRYYQPALGLTVSQDLLEGLGMDINRADILVSANARRASVAALREIVIDTLFDVEQAYWDLYYAKADVLVRQSQLERARKLVARAEAQARVGEAAPIEVTRAKASAAGQEVSILEARNLVRILTHRLLRLMGVLEPENSQRDLLLTDDPQTAQTVFSVPRSLATAVEYRPELVRTRLNIDSAEIAERRARNQCLPRLRLYGTLKAEGLGEQFGDSIDGLGRGDSGYWEVGFSIEQPLGNRASRGNLRAATALRRRAEAAYEAAVDRVARDLADAIDVLRTARGRLLRAREARTLADQLLDAEAKSFTLGRSDSLDVLNAQQAVANAERDELRARVDLAMANAALLRIQGNLPDAKGVVIDEAFPILGAP